MVKHKSAVQHEKAPTSVDVARRAGVSRTAVSYVLNGTGQAHVSEETRAKVLQAAQDLGYQMNASAQTLRKGQSNEVCLLSSVPMSANDAEIYVAIQQHALSYGYVPVAYFIGGLTDEQQRHQLLQIIARRPLALIFGPDCARPAYIEMAQRMGVMHILLGAAEESIQGQSGSILSVTLPLRKIGSMAAHHLIERGHRHLGIIHPEDPRHEPAFQERLQGMQEALEAADVHQEVQLDILPLRLSLSAARELVQQHFVGKKHPTGIYTFNDEYALPFMAALSDQGLAIPQEIALIGTDNTSFSAFVRPALSTISFDNVAFGQRFIEILALLQKNQPITEEFQRPLVPELIPRAST